MNDITYRTFLPKGTLVIEDLAYLDQIPGPRCQVIALPLKIKERIRFPVRVAAVV